MTNHNLWRSHEYVTKITMWRVDTQLVRSPHAQMADAKSVLEALTAQALFDLRGIVAVVTGGASGIGLMISSTLMANGAKVYIVDIDQERLDRVPKLYNQGAASHMGSLIGIQADISKKSEASRIAAHISSLEPNGITALFNNAGVSAGHFKRPDVQANSHLTAQDFVKALFDDIPEESFTDVYKDMTTSGFSFPYSFSKSAIGLGTASLAHELLPLGIRVNGIAPGLFPTEMAAPGTSNNLGISSLASREMPGLESPASKTGGTRFDMGMLALFLVSNWFVNGETVLIDGGTLLRHPSAF
ncbi:hypothetical protein D9756_006545 [Leucocoprinus leucothites]|uniref:Uncharacterized protein n=1 Tax=Leucocoprinus leucothites TaxID=201217 RepID=A0A8H5G2E2_9AGAR|nr:hypothetical protein D9756_006545 [Leucoagaricus leucothites]